MQIAERAAEYFAMSRQLVAYYIRRGGGNITRNVGDKLWQARIVFQLENQESRNI